MSDAEPGMLVRSLDEWLTCSPYTTDPMYTMHAQQGGSSDQHAGARQGSPPAHTVPGIRGPSLYCGTVTVRRICRVEPHPYEMLR